MAWFRILATAATLVGGGAALARNQLDKEIQKKIDAKINEARDDAIADLHQAVDSFVADQLTGFVRNLAFKAIVVAFVIGAYPLGLYNATAMKLATAFSLTLFMIRDIWVLSPTLRLVFAHAKEARWNLLEALRTMIATDVFDKAYDQVMEETQDKKVKYWMALSRHTPESISDQTANAISSVAASASVPIVRKYAGAAIAKAATLLALYSATLTGVLMLTN